MCHNMNITVKHVVPQKDMKLDSVSGNKCHLKTPYLLNSCTFNYNSVVEKESHRMFTTCQLITWSDILILWITLLLFIYLFYLRYINLKYTLDTACSLQSNQELKLSSKCSGVKVLSNRNATSISALSETLAKMQLRLFLWMYMSQTFV